MTVLITAGGQRLETSGPYQLTSAGRRSIAQGSYPFGMGSTQSHISLLGEGRTMSYAQIYRRQPWVAIAINKLARQVARLPLKVYEPGSGDDRRHIRTGRLPDLISEPWPGGGALQLKHRMAFSALLNGNSLLGKYRPSAGAPPKEFIRLDWRCVVPHGETGGPVEFWETRQTGKQLFLSTEDVLHLAWESPHGDIGVSPLEQLEVTIQSEDAAQRYGATSLGGGGRPGGILTGPEGKVIKPEDREELREQITNKDPLDGAFSMAILNHGWKVDAWSQTAVEAALIEQRRVNREEIGAVYDLAGPLIGILDHGTFSNVAELHRHLYVTTLGPWLTLIEDSFQAQVIRGEPAFEGQWVEFDLGEVLKGDPRERSVALRNFVQAGIYTINEVRKLENLPRIDLPICDEPLIPLNNLAPASQGRPTGSETEEPAGPIVSSHIARAAQRFRSKAGAGDGSAWDRDRFVRELVSDLAATNGKAAEPLAIGLADVIGAAVDQAGDDHASLEEFFAAIAATTV